MTYDDYAAIDAVNWSALREMGTSPLAYRHATATPRADTAALRLGRLIHRAILEPVEFLDSCCVYPGPVRRGREWDAFRDDNAGRDIITADEQRTAMACAAAALAHPVASMHLTGAAETEATITWTDAATKIPCKARVDRIGSAGILYELKTARSVQPWSFGRQFAQLQYHGQLAFYLDGCRAAGRELTGAPIVIAVQTEPPRDVAVYLVPDDVIDAGRELYRRLLTRLHRCLESGHWPGVCEGEMALRAPEWIYGDTDAPPVAGADLDWGGL